MVTVKYKLITETDDIEQIISKAVGYGASIVKAQPVYLKAREEAEDGVMKALARLSPDFNPKRQTCYIKRAARNAVLDMLKKQKKQLSLLDDIETAMLNVQSDVSAGPKLLRGTRFKPDVWNDVERVAKILTGATLTGEKVSTNTAMQYLVELGIKAFFGTQDEKELAA